MGAYQDQYRLNGGARNNPGESRTRRNTHGASVTGAGYTWIWISLGRYVVEYSTLGGLGGGVLVGVGARRRASGFGPRYSAFEGSAEIKGTPIWKDFLGSFGSFLGAFGGAFGVSGESLGSLLGSLGFP